MLITRCKLEIGQTHMELKFSRPCSFEVCLNDFLFENKSSFAVGSGVTHRPECRPFKVLIVAQVEPLYNLMDHQLVTSPLLVFSVRVAP